MRTIPTRDTAREVSPGGRVRVVSLGAEDAVDPAVLVRGEAHVARRSPRGSAPAPAAAAGGPRSGSCRRRCRSRPPRRSSCGPCPRRAPRGRSVRRARSHPRRRPRARRAFRAGRGCGAGRGRSARRAACGPRSAPGSPSARRRRSRPAARRFLSSTSSVCCSIRRRKRLLEVERHVRLLRDRSGNAPTTCDPRGAYGPARALSTTARPLSSSDDGAASPSARGDVSTSTACSSRLDAGGGAGLRFGAGARARDGSRGNGAARARASEHRHGPAELLAAGEQ